MNRNRKSLRWIGAGTASVVVGLIRHTHTQAKAKAMANENRHTKHCIKIKFITRHFDSFRFVSSIQTRIVIRHSSSSSSAHPHPHPSCLSIYGAFDSFAFAQSYWLVSSLFFFFIIIIFFFFFFFCSLYRSSSSFTDFGRLI